jgi:branched-chain amino acid transport system ATP-binding protein
MLLDVSEIAVSYGSSQVLFGVSLHIARGEVVTLLGRNGMGKTTMVSSIMGICQPHAGCIRFAERRIDGVAPHLIAAAGVGLVPEGRRIFPNLSVRENLVMAFRDRGDGAGRWTLDRVLAFFPRLGNGCRMEVRSSAEVSSRCSRSGAL